MMAFSGGFIDQPWFARYTANGRFPATTCSMCDAFDIFTGK